MTEAGAAERGGLLAGPYRALTIGIVALMSLAAFEYLAVATAMPTVARALDGLALYPLAFGGPLAAGVVGMVVAGGWSDGKGPAGPIWAGVALFVVGLLLAGLAPAMWLLVLGRVVQGFGAGLMTVALYVVVARVYPAELRARIFAAFAAAWVVPSIVGPAIAGLIVERVGWRWVFLAVPLLAVPAALLLRSRRRPPARAPQPRSPSSARSKPASCGAGPSARSGRRPRRAPSARPVCWRSRAGSRRRGSSRRRGRS
jgi:MFS family permease